MLIEAHSSPFVGEFPASLIVTLAGMAFWTPANKRKTRQALPDVSSHPRAYHTDMSRKLREFTNTGYWSFWVVPLADIPAPTGDRPLFGEHFETLSRLANENHHEPGLPFDVPPLSRQMLYLRAEEEARHGAEAAPFLSVGEMVGHFAAFVAAWIPPHSRDAVSRVLESCPEKVNA